MGSNAQLVLHMGIGNRICEMVSDNEIMNVPVNPRIDIDTITADDPDPKFVNVEIIRAGVSGNNRRYNNNIVKEVNDMIPGVQGFFGHPDPSKHGFEFREPQCIFVGSTIDHMADGLDRCIAKAYLLKTSPLREWIPKSIAAGKPMTVSINGTGDILRNGDIVDVVHMSDLQSIDWANPGTEGIGTSQAISVVREMEDNKGGNGMAEQINAQDIIKSATVTEFRAFNPNGYDSILSGITLTELQDKNKKLVDQIIEANKITELNLTSNGKEGMVKITELQGIIDGYESAIANLKEESEKSKITEMTTRLLSEMIPDQYRDKIAGRVTGKTEDEIKASINNEIGYIREMGGNWDNKPVSGQSRQLGDDDMKTAVGNLFGHKEDK